MMLSAVLAIALDLSAIGPVDERLFQPPEPIAQTHRSTADDYFQAGIAAFEVQDYEAAIAAWQTALEVYQTGGATHNAAITLNALAMVTLEMGHYDDAIVYGQDSVALARELENSVLEAQTLGNLGIAYQESGRYANAVETYEQALTILQSQNRPVIEAQLLGLLGNAYESLGDYDSAIATQQTSLDMAHSSGAQALEATARMNLGGLYGLQGNHTAAIVEYQVGLDLALELGNLRSAAYGLNNLGGAHQQLGDLPQAIAYFEESLLLAKQTGNRSLQATVLTNLGGAHEEQGALDHALATHQQSVAIARTLDDPRLLADTLNNLAHCQATMGQLSAAEAGLQESIELLATLRQGLEDADKVTVFDTQIYTYNLLMQIRAAQGHYEAALEASEQGRAQALVDLVADAKQAPQAATIDQIRQVAQTLNATLVEYAVVPEATFRVQGRQRGKAGQLFIWVVSPSGTVTFRQVSLAEATSSLDEQVQQSRSAMGALGRTRGLGVQLDVTPITTPQLQQMHQLLIAPIADVLPADPTELVVVIPHESLFYVPFAALQDAEERYVIDRHTLLTVPAIQLLDLTLTSRPEPSSLTSLVVGNPTMPTVERTTESTATITIPPLPPLPGTESEAQAIAHLLQTEALLGSAATEAHIMERMPAANVIHLATHGLLDYVDTRDRVPIPGAIALAPSETADGLLTAREIAQLSLDARLVVLSACDTGLGEITGDGVAGLSRSLIAAGADSTVVSLWAVPDTATADLMTVFYTNLQQGHSKAHALRQAMLKTKENYPHPLAWAAFVLVGNPNPLPY